IVFGDSAHVTWSGANVTLAESTATAVGGVDTIAGNDGDDVIVGGAAGDTITGDSGTDIVFGDNAKATFAAGVVQTITTTANGTGGADTLRGNDGDDVLAGGADGDRIDGGNGRDLIFGDNVALDRTTGDGTANARFEALSGTQIYSTVAATAGNAQVNNKS